MEGWRCPHTNQRCHQEVTRVSCPLVPVVSPCPTFLQERVPGWCGRLCLAGMEQQQAEGFQQRVALADLHLQVVAVGVVPCGDTAPSAGTAFPVPTPEPRAGPRSAFRAPTTPAGQTGTSRSSPELPSPLSQDMRANPKAHPTMFFG